VKRIALLGLFLGCGSAETHTGSGTIVGTVEGMNLASNQGVAIARMFPPTTEIKVSPSGVTCEAVQAGDRITFDLGAEKTGTYTIMVGYPNKALLTAAQARAHVCPAGGDAPCHSQVRSGTVTVTRFDAQEGGRIEGSYDLVLADGKVSGTFSAYRCD
jgi:hypothetical protein